MSINYVGLAFIINLGAFWRGVRSNWCSLISVREAFEMDLGVIDSWAMCLTTGTKLFVVENRAFLLGLVFNMIEFLHRWVVCNLVVEVGVYGDASEGVC